MSEQPESEESFFTTESSNEPAAQKVSSSRRRRRSSRKKREAKKPAPRKRARASRKRVFARQRKLLALRAVGAVLLVLGLLVAILNYFKIFTFTPRYEPLISYSVVEPDALVEKPRPKRISRSRDLAPAPPSLNVLRVEAESTFTGGVSDDFLGNGVSANFARGSALGRGGEVDFSSYEAGVGVGMGSQEEISSAFVGEFWDLKRLKNKKKSKFYEPQESMEMFDLVARFCRSGWKRSSLKPYLRSPNKLYASCFLMPHSCDEEATHAYDPSGSIGLEKSRWMAVYRAKVQAPKSGRFRFVGAGDSVMAVRFNRKNVLFAGLHDLKNGVWGNSDIYKGKNPTYHYDSCEAWNGLCNGFTAGDVIHVRQGQWYEMEVLVSEIGGGFFSFCLLIEDMNPEKGEPRLTIESKTGTLPVLQLFRTGLVNPDTNEIYAGLKFMDGVIGRVNPPYDPDSFVWPAQPM